MKAACARISDRYNNINSKRKKKQNKEIKLFFFLHKRDTSFEVMIRASAWTALPEKKPQ